MNIKNLVQGSTEWSEFRAKRFTASEAAAVFGDHKYMTRDELLRQKKTGDIAEVSPAQQRLYDKGHASEAAARHIAEKIIGEDLFPVTVEDDDGRLAASMDGLDMGGDLGWEHKLYSEKLSAHIRDVKAGICPLDNHYRWQMDQQMFVSGAFSILFMCSDGTEENCEWVWYERDEHRIDQLVEGWKQFEKDLAAYVPPERKVEVVAAVQATLPAPWSEVKGDIAITDNLKQFGQALTMYVDGINLKPQTDQDFADLDAAVKTLKDAEQKLTQCEEMALAKLDSVKDFRALVDQYRESARQTRLSAERIYKAEKENRKNAVIQNAQEALRIELDAANKEFSPVVITGVSADFYGATKGLKTIDSMQSKCNDELAMAKIALNEKRDHIRASIKLINDAGSDYKFLFSDIQQLVDKPHDHLQLVVDKRVADHKAAEQKRIDDLAAQKAEQIAAAQRKAVQAEAERVSQEERAAQKAERDRQIAEHEKSIRAGIELAREQGSIKPDLLDEVSATVTDLAASLRATTDIPRPAGIRPPETKRPSDSDIINVLTAHYQVSRTTVIGWLMHMDTESEFERVANL